MGKRKEDISRRDLLKILGAASASLPLGQLVRLIATGMVEKAYAAEIGATGKRYVYFCQQLAPPRWVFDLLLTPYSTNFTANPMVGTVGVSSGGRYTGTAYQTIQRKGINVPPIWGANVPAPGGGTRALDTLLDNVLVIRGVDIGTASHPSAQKLNFRPIGAEYSVMGLIADAGSGFPLKGINAGAAEFTFASQNHYSAVQLPPRQGSQLGRVLLNPFNSQASAAFKSNKTTVQAELNAAKTALDNFANSQHPGAAQIKTVQEDTDMLKGAGLAALLTKYDQLYAKYLALVGRAITEGNVAGVTDQPVGESTRPANMRPYMVRGAAIQTPLDMRAMFTANTTCPGLAEAFALAELVVTENICNSVTAPIQHFSNLSANGGTTAERNDQHDSGSLAGLLLNTKLYLAIGACMAEFISVLKAQNLFNQTVVHLGGEFNRMPRPDMGGSDHAPIAGSGTIWSGIVQGPLVIGNVRQNAPSATYPGSYGWAAPSINGRNMDIGDLANALTTMLGIPEIVRRGASEQVIALNGAGKVVSRIGQATQV